MTRRRWPAEIRDGEARLACADCARWLRIGKGDPPWPWLGAWWVTPTTTTGRCECGAHSRPMFVAELLKIDALDDTEEPDLP